LVHDEESPSAFCQDVSRHCGGESRGGIVAGVTDDADD
jgi:hypothetical protein